MNTARLRLGAALLVLAIALAACGGGGGTLATVTPQPTAVPTDTPSPAPTEASTRPAAEGTSAATAVALPSVSTGLRQYTVEFTLTLDPGNAQHDVERSGPMPHVLQVIVGNDALQIRGDLPFVTVAGALAADGRFTAMGAGRAGMTGGIVDAKLEGTMSNDSLSGSYTIGANGQLPGGQPVTYSLTGQIRP